MYTRKPNEENNSKDVGKIPLHHLLHVNNLFDTREKKGRVEGRMERKRRERRRQKEKKQFNNRKERAMSRAMKSQKYI